MKLLYDIVTRITKVKNSIRALLSREDIHLPNAKKGWTIKALALIRDIALPIKEITNLEDIWKGHLHCEFELLDNLTEQLRNIESKLDDLGRLDENVKRLRTIPGVGPRLSEAAVAIIDDPHRFKNGRHVSSYLGMVPRRWQTGRTLMSF